MRVAVGTEISRPPHHGDSEGNVRICANDREELRQLRREYFQSAAQILPDQAVEPSQPGRIGHMIRPGSHAAKRIVHVPTQMLAYRGQVRNGLIDLQPMRQTGVGKIDEPDESHRHI